MARDDNPPNPFAAARLEREVPAPPVRRSIFEERARTVLCRNNSPDIPYRWSVNPYRGCGHACGYCYARRTHEYLDLGAGSDFECRLTVKTNAAEQLRTELARPRWTREVIAFSGVTDCYQPIERDYALTRACLAVCVDVGNPVSVVTKSDLVTRDIDLLRELRRRRDASVMLTIRFADDRMSRLIEPGAPPTSRRFQAMRALREAGLDVRLLIAPVIPGLNDRDLPALLQQAADCGATGAGYAPVRLPGSVADVFLGRLRRVLPAAADRTEARIRDMRGGLLNNPGFGCRMTGSGPYWESVQRLFETMATRVGLDGGQSWRRRGPAVAASRQLSLFGPDA